MSPLELADRIRRACREEGFTRCGIAPAVSSAGFDDLVRWVDAGYAGEMHYIADRLDAYRHPSGVLPGARSIVALAYPYPAFPAAAGHDLSPAADGHHSGSDSGETVRPTPLRPTVARYTLGGADYHDVLHPKLKRVCRLIREWQPSSRCRGVVDTAPLMEREIAQRAGLGWRGKNTLLLNKTDGSYFFLACLLVDVELPADAPHHASHCGTCTACLDACPTDAFPQPGVLDATKCISYWTIESRELPPPPLRPQIGQWVFGCDVCQEVCPWNRKPARRQLEKPGDPRGDNQTDRHDEQVATTAPEKEHPSNRATNRQLAGISPATQPPIDDPTPPHQATLEQAIEWMRIGEDEFRSRFRSTPMWRTRRRGWLRNVAIVLGNAGDRRAVGVLVAALRDGEPLVRASSVWALSQILAADRPQLADICRRPMADEQQPIVLAEYARALDS